MKIEKVKDIFILILIMPFLVVVVLLGIFLSPVDDDTREIYEGTGGLWV